MKTSFSQLPCFPKVRRGHILSRILAGLAALECLAIQAESALAQTWTTTTAPIANWVSVASSADGNRLAALIQGGEAAYISTNAGTTWTPSSLANGGALGSSIACSADGSILFVAGTTQIYRSTNSGTSWAPSTSPSASWTSIACSADGTRLAGAMSIRRGSPAGIVTSPDAGMTWASTSASSESWVAIASSADGRQTRGGRRNGKCHLHLDRCRKHLDPAQSATPAV